MTLLYLKITMIAILILSALFDFLYHRIPNCITFSATVLAILFHIFNDHFQGFFFAIAGLLAGIGLLFPLYLFRMMGAGDVKLMGAVGAVLGPKGTFSAFLFSAIIGGIYALAVIMFNNVCRLYILKRFFLMGKTLLLTGQVSYVPPNEEERKIKLYYGIAIAAGTISYMFFEYTGYPSWVLFLSRL